MEIKNVNPDDVATPVSGTNVDRKVVNSTGDLSLEGDEEIADEELRDGKEGETDELDSDSMEGDDTMDEEDESESDDVTADDNESEEDNEDVEEKAFKKSK